MERGRTGGGETLSKVIARVCLTADALRRVRDSMQLPIREEEYAVSVNGGLSPYDAAHERETPGEARGAEARTGYLRIREIRRLSRGRCPHRKYHLTVIEAPDHLSPRLCIGRRAADELAIDMEMVSFRHRAHAIRTCSLRCAQEVLTQIHDIFRSTKIFNKYLRASEKTAERANAKIVIARRFSINCINKRTRIFYEKFL